MIRGFGTKCRADRTTGTRIPKNRVSSNLALMFLCNRTCWYLSYLPVGGTGVMYRTRGFGCMEDTLDNVGSAN
jgi:hypothetical protein